MKKLTATERKKLERVMCTLINFEPHLRDALAATGGHPNDASKVYRALRRLVDGE